MSIAKSPEQRAAEAAAKKTAKDKKNAEKAAKKKAEADKKLRDQGLNPVSQSGIEAITDPAPTGPLARTKLVRGEDGKLHSVYIDAKSGETLTDLKGYTIIDGETYYKADSTADNNKDGKVSTTEATAKSASLADTSGTSTISGGSSESQDVLKRQGNETVSNPGPKGTMSNNFGYKDKPGLLSRTATTAMGMINPGLGAAAKVLGTAYNVSNTEAVSNARKAIGLPGLTGTQQVKGIFSDNKGKVARVGLNDQNYSVSLGDAVDDLGRTTMTPEEASTRAQQADVKLSEIPDTKPSLVDKGLSRVENATGLERGWAAKMLDKAFGIAQKTPETAPTPTARPENITQMTPSPNPSPSVSSNSTPGIAPTPTAAPEQNKQAAGLPSFNDVANSPSTVTDTGAGYGTKAIGTTSQPQSVPGTTVGGVGLMSGLSPAQGRPNMPGASITTAAQKAVAETFGPGYSVSVTSGTESKGMAQVGSSRHKTGLAMDFDVVDPTGQKVMDANKLNEMASQFALDNPNAGIGFGKGYMALGRMHLDITGQAKQWGAANTVKNMDPALSQTIDAARVGYQPTPFSNPATPTPSPGAPSASFTSQDDRANVPDRMGMPDYSSAGPMPSSPVDNSTTRSISRTPTEKAAMARSIAGQMSQKSLSALSKNDPAAKAEVGSMMKSMSTPSPSPSTGLGGTPSGTPGYGGPGLGYGGVGTGAAAASGSLGNTPSDTTSSTPSGPDTTAGGMSSPSGSSAGDGHSGIGGSKDNGWGGQ